MKISTSKSSWTQFWKDLGVSLGKEDTLSKENINRKDKIRLRRLGVENGDIEKVIHGLEAYKDGYKQFHRMVYLYARDPDTVERWTCSSSRSQAFIRLFSKLKKLSRNTAKIELRKLILLFELFRKREIVKYQAEHREPISIKVISLREITTVLRLGEKNSRFKGEGITSYNGFRAFAVSKKTGGQEKVYKFVLIKKAGNNIYINLALDKADEKSRLLYHLAKKYHIHTEKVKEKPDFSKFVDFINNGQLDKFTLSGIEFNNRDYKIAISPKFGKPSNITSCELYKSNVPDTQGDLFEKVIRLRIYFVSEWTTYVNFLFINYQNENIIGGIRVNLEAFGLNLSKREVVKDAFSEAFGFQLDTSLVSDVSQEEIFKKYLFNPPQKRKSIEAVSNETLIVAQTLKKYKLLPEPTPQEESARICTDSACPKKFKPQWTDDGVCECGKELWTTGYTVVTQVIDEQKVRNFVKKICNENGFIVKNLDKKLVNRKIYPLEVSGDSDSIIFVPITTPLKEEQLEILRYRFPNAVFVTSRDDVKEIKDKNIVAIELYKLAYELINGDPKEKINNLIYEVLRNKNRQLDHLASDSASRLPNDRWYLDKKTLGPEFFEADIFTIQNYIFKNSTWLGAKERGKPFPDTQTAYPVELNGQRGCFISDAKFSSGDAPDVGSAKKNKKYIVYGRENKFIKNNGGLRGFIFISNKSSPSNFTSLITSIIGNKYIMGSFMTVTQLLLIYEHLKKYESEFDKNHKKRDVFLDTLERFFTKPISYKKDDKFKIWDNDSVIQVLFKSEQRYSKI